jgi:hypothetical protein
LALASLAVRVIGRGKKNRLSIAAR